MARLLLVGLLVCIAASSHAGDYLREDITLNHTRLLISYSDDITGRDREKLRTWLDSVTAAMLLLNGEPARPALRIVLDAYPSSRGPVPFAQILRRSPEGVKFYVNPRLPLDDFIRDWTAYHELTHLYIPYPGQADVWFSEGLASYYQNVIQYRAGLLTEAQAWQKLVNGFERGRKDDRDTDLNLTELSKRLRERYAFMRVYWSGALYFLEADMLLRAATKNTQSTDTVLRDFGICCLNQQRRWTGREIAAEFDRLSGTDIFTRLFPRYASSTGVPDYKALLARAGVKLVDGKIVIDAGNRPSHALGGLDRPAPDS
jgi:hypothetical protein